MIDDRSTGELEELLENMKPNELEQYYRENEKFIANDRKAFYFYMKDMYEKKGKKLKDVYSFAGESESWGGKIITMERHTSDRNAILRLCLVGEFKVQEINRALKLYGMAPLYAKDKRDAAIIVAVNNGIYNLADLDDILMGQGFEKLSKDEEE